MVGGEKKKKWYKCSVCKDVRDTIDGKENKTKQKTRKQKQNKKKT